MLKYFVPAGLILLLAASCGQQATNQSPAVTKQDTLAPAKDTEDPIPPGSNVKADGYYDKADLDELPPGIAPFVPQGYSVMDTCSGDLNRDTWRDMLVVLRQNGEDSLSKTTDSTIKRRLLILTAQADGSYKLAAQSDNVVYCYTCGGVMGDPFMGLVIKNGYFSIEHYGGSRERWEQTITFKYAAEDSTWYLHKDGTSTFDAVDESARKKTKILTVKDFGKVPFDQYDVYK